MTEFKCIMVPLDGSPLAESALPVATTLAQKFGSHIILLRVLDIPPSTVRFQAEVPPRWVTEALRHNYQEVEEYLVDRQDELRQQGFDVQTLVRETSPAEDIIDAAVADDVDLIVMSTHGRGGLARWTFGSVADKVVRHSPCPVLLIRQKPEGESES